MFLFASIFVVLLLGVSLGDALHISWKVPRRIPWILATGWMAALAGGILLVANLLQRGTSHPLIVPTAGIVALLSFDIPISAATRFFRRYGERHRTEVPDKLSLLDAPAAP